MLDPAFPDGDSILLVCHGHGENCLALTPQQARSLATELISAVNKAEVKHALRSPQQGFRRRETATTATPGLMPAAHHLSA